jgi:hypothetical protein
MARYQRTHAVAEQEIGAAWMLSCLGVDKFNQILNVIMELLDMNTLSIASAMSLMLKTKTKTKTFN